ncbi:MAG TPA: glycosyl hydrolase, partial [Thermoanaerobaculia bacterium]|nr:glycosyl hydrolase [Thermoanaerobaculia bacterium]
MRSLLALVLALALVAPAAAARHRNETSRAKPQKESSVYKASTFTGLELRNIGPALTSGRIADFAIDPMNGSVWYVAAASGGVWKTVNAGTTWTPIFDHEGSYSIGCVAVDPSNPLTVWVGTGENNSQRSVSYGDGVYKSVDGGRNWKRMGLKDSEHIGKILVDPRHSNVVYVAAQGPLWKAGG